jgi:TP901 family phage tail tape measure protein
MTRVRAVSQATTQEFGRLRQSALDLASGTKYTAVQVSQGMQFMAMAGMKTNQIVGGMPHVLDLAAAGAIDLGSAADIVTNIMAGFGQSTEQLGGSVDVMVKAITSANVDVAQLGSAFKYVGPVAKSAGISFEDTAASIALLGNAGIQGSMAGTTLRGAFARLLNPSAEVRDALASLGVKLTDSSGKLLGMTEIIKRLEPHAANTGAIMQIFGLRAGPGMAALIGMGSDALDQLITKLEDSGGIAKRIAEAEMKTFSGQMLILGSQVERLAIEIGEILMPAARKLNEWARAAIGWFQDLGKGWKVAAVILGGVTAAVAGLTAVLALVGLAIPGLATGFAFLGTVATGVGAAITAAFWPVVVAIGVVVGAIAGVILYVGLLKKAWKADFGYIRTIVMSFVDTTKTIAQKIYEAFVFVKKWVVIVVKEMVNMALKGLGWVTTAIEKITMGKIDIQLPTTADELFDDVKDKAKDIGKVLGDAFSDAGEVFGYYVDDLAEGAKTIGGFFVDSFKDGFATIKSLFTATFDELMQDAFDMPAQLAAATAPAMATVPGAPGGKVDRGMMVSELSAAMADAFRQASADLELKAAVSEGEARGEGPAKVMGAAGGMVNSVVDSLGSAGELITSTVEGFTKGGVWGAAAAAFTSLFKESKAFKTLLKVGARIFGVLVKVLEPFFNALGPVIAALGNILTPLLGLFSILKLLIPIIDLVGRVLMVVGKILHAIMSVVAKIWNTLIEIVAKIVGIFSGGAARALRRSKINMYDTSSAYDEATSSVEDNTEAVDESTSSMGDLNSTVKEVNASLGNVPDVFKVASARFGAIVGEDVVPAAVAGAGGGSAPFEGATIIVQVSDPEEAADRLAAAARNRNFGERGTTVIGAPRSVSK